MPSEQSFAGRAALVTGASRGIGRAVAVELARRGAAVACAARATDAAPLRLPGTIDGTVRSITDTGGHAVAVPTNLAEPSHVERMIARCVDQFGRLDIVVNNAAVTFGGDTDIDPRRLDLLWAINVTAPVLALQAARPHLTRSGGGRVVNVSSFAAVRYVPNMGPYGASKAALERLTVMSGTELRDEGIAVNAFRIDTAVATEGFIDNSPGTDHSSWAHPDVAAAGIAWLLQQPLDHTARLESMLDLADTTDSMPSLRGRRNRQRQTR